MSSAKYASTPQQDEATIGAIDYLLKTIAPDRKPLEESVPAEDPKRPKEPPIQKETEKAVEAIEKYMDSCPEGFAPCKIEQEGSCPRRIPSDAEWAKWWTTDGAQGKSRAKQVFRCVPADQVSEKTDRDDKDPQEELSKALIRVLAAANDFQASIQDMKVPTWAQCESFRTRGQCSALDLRGFDDQCRFVADLKKGDKVKVLSNGELFDGEVTETPGDQMNVRVQFSNGSLNNVPVGNVRLATERENDVGQCRDGLSRKADKLIEHRQKAEEVEMQLKDQGLDQEDKKFFGDYLEYLQNQQKSLFNDMLAEQIVENASNMLQVTCNDMIRQDILESSGRRQFKTDSCKGMCVPFDHDGRPIRGSIVSDGYCLTNEERLKHWNTIKNDGRRRLRQLQATSSVFNFIDMESEGMIETLEIMTRLVYISLRNKYGGYDEEEYRNDMAKARMEMFTQRARVNESEVEVVGQVIDLLEKNHGIQIDEEPTEEERK